MSIIKPVSIINIKPAFNYLLYHRNNDRHINHAFNFLFMSPLESSLKKLSHYAITDFYYLARLDKEFFLFFVVININFHKSPLNTTKITLRIKIHNEYLQIY